MEREPLVSVNIPCYRQLEYARRLIPAILSQSLADLEVILLDDDQSDEYRRYVDAIGDARVRYQRNPVRLGAMRNMFAAIVAGRGRYSLAFHEDDWLRQDYLSAAVGILESHPECGFVACEVHEFQNEPTGPEALTPEPPRYNLYASGADFLRAICGGVEPMFGSIVYRRAALLGLRPAHDEFATLVDRPFLLTILRRWSGAVIREPLVWYRKHGESDDRHLAMRTDHILRLFKMYRSTLPKSLGPEDEALFYAYSGYWLFALFHLVPPHSRPSFRRFLFRAWREGLYDPRWAQRYGRKRLLKSLLVGG